VDRGPLLATLRVESSAPGAVVSCGRHPHRGSDRLDFATTVDKSRAPAGAKGDYYGDASKESVNLAFPFDVEGGQVRMELPLGGVIRPTSSRCRVLQELVHHRQLDRRLGARPRRHAHLARRTAASGGRPDGEPVELAIGSRVWRASAGRRRISIRG